MSRFPSLFSKAGWQLMVLFICSCVSLQAHSQIKLDKINKTLRDATTILNTTAQFVNAANRTSAEFGKTVKVMKGDNSETPSTVPSGEVTKPKIKKGEFTNLRWEPVAYFDKQLFPSTIISMATYKGKIEGEMEAISRPLGFRIISSNANIPLKWEIECVDKRFFDKASGSFIYQQAGSEVYLMPEIPWQYDALGKQLASAPLNVYFRLFDEEGNKVEKLVSLLLRSVNDCLFQYKELDLSFLFTGFIQEEHPEIDKILKEALNTKMITAISGYQGSEQNTYKQVAAIWRVLHDRGFQYSSITSTAGSSDKMASQAVRTFDNAMKTQQANCVDGTVVFASILRKIGISPIMVLIPGHCFLGYYTDKTKQNVAFLETTLLSNSDYLDKAKTPAEKSKAYLEEFNMALASGMATYKKQSLKDVHLVDVDKWRAYVKPIPF